MIAAVNSKKILICYLWNICDSLIVIINDFDAMEDELLYSASDKNGEEKYCVPFNEHGIIHYSWDIVILLELKIDKKTIRGREKQKLKCWKWIDDKSRSSKQCAASVMYFLRTQNIPLFIVFGSYTETYALFLVASLKIYFLIKYHNFINKSFHCK